MTLSSKGQLLAKRYLTIKDAYVTGFFFATIDSIPPHFVSYMQSEYSGGWTEDKITRAFTSLSVDIALPQETLKTTSMPGRAGFSRTSPLFSQHGHTVSVKFLVDQTLEATVLITAWYKYITMVADGRIDAEQASNASNVFGANFYYCTLLPNMSDIVFAFAGEEFYPITNPFNDFSHNLQTVSGLEHNVQFNVGYYDTWAKGKTSMLWLKTYLNSRIDSFKDFTREEEIAKLDPDLQPDYSMKDVGKLSYKYEQPENNHFGQNPELDKRGVNKKSKENQGSVYDKFNGGDYVL